MLVQEAEKQNAVSRDEINKQLEIARRSILIQCASITSYLKKIRIIDKEIKAEYDRYTKQNAKQYHAKHILVKDEADAQNTVSQLNKGANFEKLAKEKSVKPSDVPPRGGDVGWAAPANYMKPFSDAMTALNKGQVTKTPVKSPFGYHIIKLVDTRKPTLPSLDQVKPKIRTMLEEKKWQEYELNLMKQAKVE